VNGIFKSIAIGISIIFIIVGYYVVSTIGTNEYNIPRFVKYKLQSCNELVSLEKDKCVQDIADRILYKDGILSAFEFLKTAFQYEKFTARGCFWDTGVLAQYKEELLKETTVGEVGFEKVLPRAVYNCYFLIGKIVAAEPLLGSSPQGIEKILENTLPLCALISKEIREQNECEEGVYSLAIEHMGENNIQDDLFSLCRSQPDQYKPQCFYEFARTADIKKGDFFRMHSVIMQAPTESLRESVTKAIVSTGTRGEVRSDNFEKTVNGCRSFQTQGVREACVRALVVGVWEASDIGEEYQQGDIFCSNNFLTQVEKQSCYKTLFGELSVIYSIPKMQKVCNKFSQEYQHICVL